MSVKSVITLLLLSLLVFNCASGIKDFNYMRYTDQNNNVFNITAQKITYRAVQPVNSSTGFYSGGEDVEQVIDKNNYESVKQLVNELMGDQDLHAAKREKTTAVIEVFTMRDSQKAILKPSEKRNTLENLLHRLKS